MMMFIRQALLIAASLASAFTLASPPWQLSNIEYFSVPTSTEGVVAKKAALRFSNNQRIELPIENAKVITLLRGANDSQFVLAQGTDCTECDESATVRLFQLNAEGLVANDKRYYNAGTEFDFYQPETKTAENEVYYGQCSDAADDVVVWFSEFIGTDDKWHDFHSIATLSASGVTLQELDEQQLNREQVLKKVAAGVCGKIQPSTWLSEP